jgi:hypothetical protein
VNVDHLWLGTHAELVSAEKFNTLLADAKKLAASVMSNVSEEVVSG